MAKLFWAVLAIGLASPAGAQQQADHHEVMSAQAEALAPFAWMKGIWRGPASQQERGGEIHLIQTERVGPMLSGSAMVVEGRGYDPETGTVEFNALGVISYDPESGAYHFDALANGQHGHFPIALREGGFDWFIERGIVKIRYEVRLVEGQWIETGFMKIPERDEMQFFKMTLNRVGNTDWPLAGAVPMKE